MPKYLEFNSGPHKKLRVIGHDTAEDYDREAKESGACVETADRSDIYRDVLPVTLHPEFAKILSKNSAGVKRGVNEDATAKAKAKAKDADKVNPVEEAYVTFANKVKQAVPEDEWKALDAECHTFAEQQRCDASPSARQRGPDAGALSKADDILADTEDNREGRIAKLLAVVDSYELERDEAGLPERNSLARLVTEYIKASI